ncbi:MAG: DUF3667 domain-containing protein [Flavobacteriales bacterium]|nr:DUF3667 domain-containing protein [Flavobacteriales bacterium]
MNCTNCNSPILDDRCLSCVTKPELKKIDRHYVTHELMHLFHIEKGFLYSVKELITRPGDSIRHYITSDRTKHMKPIPFLIFCALLYTVIAHYFKPIEVVNDEVDFVKGSYVKVIREWIDTHYGYTYIMMSVFIAGWARLLFKKYSYNFYEIMTLLCYVLGQGMLFTMLELPLHKYINQYVFNVIAIGSTLAYPTFAIGQFFDKSKITSYVKAFLTFLLGHLSFYFVVLGIGFMLDIILKKP